jgi:hypothetical protein
LSISVTIGQKKEKIFIFPFQLGLYTQKIPSLITVSLTAVAQIEPENAVLEI